jgi:hypothetical protein
VGSACLLKTLKACSGPVDRAHVVLEDHLWGGGGTAHLREPSEMGWAPMGLAGIAEIVPESDSVKATCSGLEVADGRICFLGDIHGRESTRAPEPGQLHGIASVRVHAVTGLFRPAGGRHNPAGIALFA